jgi:hypothetical protein
MVNLTIFFCWSLEQSSRRQLFEYFSLEQPDDELISYPAQVIVPNVLDIAYQPWGDDPDCREYTVGFIRNGSRPKMALVSYPGSGNTWTRGIIERLSGYFTGSIYAEKNLYIKGGVPDKRASQNYLIKCC